MNVITVPFVQTLRFSLMEHCPEDSSAGLGSVSECIVVLPYRIAADTHAIAIILHVSVNIEHIVVKSFSGGHHLLK